MKIMCIPILLFILATTPACATQSAGLHTHEGGLRESLAVNISYPSPATALAAVRAKPNVTTEENEEWFILNDKAENSLWSITKPSHFAHPTAVLRHTYEKDGRVFMGMDVKCGNSKGNCDRVVQQFIELNNKIYDQFNVK